MPETLTGLPAGVYGGCACFQELEGIIDGRQAGKGRSDALHRLPAQRGCSDVSSCLMDVGAYMEARWETRFAFLFLRPSFFRMLLR